jgi:hypothetical protein
MSQENDFHFTIRYFNKIIAASIIAFFLGIILIIGSYITANADPPRRVAKNKGPGLSEWYAFIEN